MTRRLCKEVWSCLLLLMVMVYETIIRAVLARQFTQTLIVGVDGIDASGKTVFADELGERLRQVTDRQVVRISLDGFLNPEAIRMRQGRLSAQGQYDDWLNITAVIALVLNPLRELTPRYTPAIYNKEGDVEIRANPLTIPTGSIVIIDSIFLARPEFRAALSMHIWLEVNDSVALGRMVRRARERNEAGDLIRLKQMFTERYLGAQVLYKQVAHPTLVADFIIDNNDFIHPVIRSQKTPTGERMEVGV